MSKFLDSNGLKLVWDKVKELLGKKVDVETGKGLSTNDYTTEEKTKLAGLSNYTHPGASGSKHIPSGGADGQVLRWSADGVAMWGADKDTTYAPMVGAVADANGQAGLVPAPAAGAQSKFLRGDGTWGVPIDTTYTPATTSADGLLSKEDKTKLDAFGAATDYALKSDISTVYRYKGSVDSQTALPTTGNKAGDVYNTADTDMNYAWTGKAWDPLGSTVVIEPITNDEINAVLTA